MALAFPACAGAHAFGQRYDLPLPLSLYLWGAGSAVLLSFLVAVVFLRVPGAGKRKWSRDISNTAVARWLTAPAVRGTFKMLSLFLFLLVLATGLFGTSNPSKNFAPIFVWVIWWVGMAYLAAILGNFWDLVNPWRVIYNSLQSRIAALRTPRFSYPQWLGTWPAVLLFFLFAWLEFISGIAEQPATLAWLIIGYSLITFTGMRAFGADTWLRHGEAFSVVFGLIAKFGLFRGGGKGEPALSIRVPGYGLLSRQPVSLSLMAFTILMLTTVSFDGFVETPLWLTLSNWVRESLAAGAASTAQQAAYQAKLIMTLALLLFYSLFIIVYIGFSHLVARLSGPNENTMLTARTYVLTLVPIAIAYHLSHYMSYLLLAGQLIIPIASDPFGFGWDLFGTAKYRIDITVINAKNVWYLSVCAIVIGHIIAVCLAHATAIRQHGHTATAIISQLPMLVLMVSYTMISLWILSQPIIAD